MQVYLNMILLFIIIIIYIFNLFKIIFMINILKTKKAPKMLFLFLKYYWAIILVAVRPFCP